MDELIFSPIPVEFFSALGPEDELKDRQLQAIANIDFGSDIDTLDECVMAFNYLKSLRTDKEEVNLAAQWCYDATEVSKKQSGNSVVIKNDGNVIKFTTERDGHHAIENLMDNETIRSYFSIDVPVYDLMSNGTDIYLITERGVYQSNANSCGSYFDFSCVGEPYYVRSDNTLRNGCDKLKGLFFDQQDNLTALMTDGRTLPITSLEPQGYCWHKTPRN